MFDFVYTTDDDFFLSLHISTLLHSYHIRNTCPTTTTIWTKTPSLCCPPSVQAKMYIEQVKYKKKYFTIILACSTFHTTHTHSFKNIVGPHISLRIYYCWNSIVFDAMNVFSLFVIWWRILCQWRHKITMSRVSKVRSQIGCPRMSKKKEERMTFDIILWHMVGVYCAVTNDKLLGRKHVSERGQISFLASETENSLTIFCSLHSTLLVM